MQGFMEVTREDLRDEVLKYAIDHNKEVDGDIIYLRERLYYVHLKSGLVTTEILDCDKEEENGGEDSGI